MTDSDIASRGTYDNPAIAALIARVADRGYVIQTGQVVLADTAENLLQNPLMREAYLGEL